MVFQKIVFVFSAFVSDVKGDHDVSFLFQQGIGLVKGDQRFFGFCDTGLL